MTEQELARRLHESAERYEGDDALMILSDGEFWLSELLREAADAFSDSHRPESERVNMSGTDLLPMDEVRRIDKELQARARSESGSAGAPRAMREKLEECMNALRDAMSWWQVHADWIGHVPQWVPRSKAALTALHSPRPKEE